MLRSDTPAQHDDLAAIAVSAGLQIERRDDHLVLTLADGVDAHRLASEINRRAHTAGIVLTVLHHERADLEARYLELVNNHTIHGGPS